MKKRRGKRRKEKKEEDGRFGVKQKIMYLGKSKFLPGKNMTPQTCLIIHDEKKNNTWFYSTGNEPLPSYFSEHVRYIRFTRTM